MKKQLMKKVVLAYSGGLDTSVIIPWLKNNFDNCQVIAVCIDAGQKKDDFKKIKAKALKSGASKAYIIDAKNEFLEKYVTPLIKAGCKYEGQYIQGTLTRPLISKKLVEIAKKEKATVIAHGATGKGNDQVRFEHAIQSLDDTIKVIAPWRHWEIKSRNDAIKYAKANNVPVVATKKSPYSIDENFWYVSHEGGVLEGTDKKTPYDCLWYVKPPEKAKEKAEVVKVGFKKGIPNKLNGKILSLKLIIEKLNKIGASHGVGINDIIESRLVGMKVRGVYESPGAEIIFQAHKILETLCIDRDTLSLKQQMEIQYANLIYEGKWFTQTKESLDAFFNITNKNLTGEVSLKLYKGNVMFNGATSPYSLFDSKLATFEEENVYNQADAIGFINLYSLPAKVYNKVQRKNK